MIKTNEQIIEEFMQDITLTMVSRRLNTQIMPSEVEDLLRQALETVEKRTEERILKMANEKMTFITDEDDPMGSIDRRRFNSGVTYCLDILKALTENK